MKRLIIILCLAVLSIAGYTQRPLKGFLRPVPKDLFGVAQSIDRDMAVNQRASVWLPRPAVNLTAIKWQWNKETKSFSATSFNSIGVGIGYQHFTATSDGPLNDYGLNGLLLLGEHICAGITISALGIINVGVDYNFTLRSFEPLTGIVIKF